MVLVTYDVSDGAQKAVKEKLIERGYSDKLGKYNLPNTTLCSNKKSFPNEAIVDLQEITNSLGIELTRAFATATMDEQTVSTGIVGKPHEK